MERYGLGTPDWERGLVGAQLRGIEQQRRLLRDAGGAVGAAEAAGIVGSRAKPWTVEGGAGDSWPWAVELADGAIR